MTKQFFIFIIVGGIQYLLDAASFSLLILFFSTETSNILSRMIGALAGYGLNGMITFKHSSKSQIHANSLLRFILVWCLMTLISTLAIRELIAAFCNDSWICAVAIKLLVEMVLVILSFTLQKLFVYKI